PWREVLGDLVTTEPSFTEGLGAVIAKHFGERGLGGDERLLDVLRGVLAGGKQDMVVRVVGAGALEDLEVYLLAHLRIHGFTVLAGWRRGHQGSFQRGWRSEWQSARCLVNRKDERVNWPGDEDSGARVGDPRGRRRAAGRRSPRGRVHAI